MNQSYDVVFYINLEEYIVMQLPFPKDTLERFDRIKVIFHTKGHQYYSIYNETDLVLRFCYNFLDRLEQVLSEEREVDAHIQGDLGFLWNEHLHECSLHDICTGHPNDLRLERYILFASAYAETVWMYNKKGKIMFQITPGYPWHFRTPKPEHTFIPYEDFRSSYKSLLTLTLDRATVERWIEQVKELFIIMNKNYAEACRLSGYEPEPPAAPVAEGEAPVMTFAPIPEISVKEDLQDVAVCHPCAHHEKRNKI